MQRLLTYLEEVTHGVGLVMVEFEESSETIGDLLDLGRDHIAPLHHQVVQCDEHLLELQVLGEMIYLSCLTAPS